MCVTCSSAPHLTDTSPFQRSVQIDGPVAYVGRADWNRVTGECCAGIACPHLVLGRVNDHNSTLVQATKDFQCFSDGFQIIRRGAYWDNNQIGDASCFCLGLCNRWPRVDEHHPMLLAKCRHGGGQIRSIKVKEIRPLQSRLQRLSSLPPLSRSTLWITIYEDTGTGFPSKNRELARQGTLSSTTFLADK